MRCFFGHRWPNYFSAIGHIAHDGVGVHHLYMQRKCLDCPALERGSVHVPREYVEAVRKVKLTNQISAALVGLRNAVVSCFGTELGISEREYAVRDAMTAANEILKLTEK